MTHTAAWGLWAAWGLSLIISAITLQGWLKFRYNMGISALAASAFLIIMALNQLSRDISLALLICSPIPFLLQLIMEKAK